MKTNVQIAILSHLSDAQHYIGFGDNEHANRQINFAKLLVQTYKNTDIEVETEDLDNLWTKFVLKDNQQFVEWVERLKKGDEMIQEIPDEGTNTVKPVKVTEDHLYAIENGYNEIGMPLIAAVSLLEAGIF